MSNRYWIHLNKKNEEALTKGKHMKNEIQLEDFRLAIVALWKNKVLIILVTLTGIFGGLLFTSLNTSSLQYYSATASVYAATYGSYELSQTDIKTMVNYSDVVTSRKVCEYAASLLKETSITADEIQNTVNMSFSNNSYVMKISAVHQDPDLVIMIVNAVAEAFVTEVTNITGNNSIQILDEANSVFTYQSNSINKIRLFFAAGSFGFICGLIAIKELLSKKVRSIPQCVEDDTEILGLIPHMD